VITLVSEFICTDLYHTPNPQAGVQLHNPNRHSHTQPTTEPTITIPETKGNRKFSQTITLSLKKLTALHQKNNIQNEMKQE